MTLNIYLSQSSLNNGGLGLPSNSVSNTHPSAHFHSASLTKPDASLFGLLSHSLACAALIRLSMSLVSASVFIILQKVAAPTSVCCRLLSEQPARAGKGHEKTAARRNMVTLTRTLYHTL